VRACWLAQFSRAAWYRQSQARDQSALRLRIREIAHARPRRGYLRIWVMLRREGWPISRKRVRRRYRLDGLQVRMRVRRRKHMAWPRGPAPIPAGPTERWSMEFVHDAFADGKGVHRHFIADIHFLIFSTKLSQETQGRIFFDLQMTQLAAR